MVGYWAVRPSERNTMLSKVTDSLASIPLPLINKITLTRLTEAISLNDMTSNFLSGRDSFYWE